MQTVKAGPGDEATWGPITSRADPRADCSEVTGWIPVSEQRPPLTHETPETDGFFLMLRHNPKRDAPGKYRMHLWFGSVPIDCTHWARIHSLPNVRAELHPAAREE